ncbi:MAG TPA: peptide ABC transporter substrate-binding protein [Thermomicrobiales bacterium]|nr:peptide ABC transporter substrate-binding protein [Thermomicrobiales bacterium]
MASQNHASGPLRALYEGLKAGNIDRRTFVHRASLLGVSAASAVFLANTAGVAAQDASPAATAAAGSAERPAAGTENQERGAGGELKLIQWQAPTLLSPHVATGVKDFLASVLVLEPLMHYLPDATMIPNLVTEVPSVENGSLSEDLTEVTLKLLPDVVWSDGEPFTAEDVVFTIDWVKNPENASVNINTFETIESAEAVDEHTVKVTFAESNPLWFDPFTGTSTGFVYPRHVLEGGPEAHEAFLSSPVGTGPYVVESFTPNDQATYVINENYREPNKPFFSRVQLKGGGDAPAAARSVLQTGEYHFAWNLQVEPNVLSDMEAEEAPGALVPYPGVSIERINFNFSDPWTEVDGQRSHFGTPHPFLTDDAVREAIATAIDREQIANEFYGQGQQPATNILYGDPETESENTTREFDPEKAAQLLDEAGWTLNGDVRSKDGVELSAVYATSVNSVRQKTQAVVKSNLEAIGIKVQLEQIDAGIYFDGSAGNEQNINHFYWDMCMYQGVPNSPRPLSFFETWYAGPDGQNVAQAANEWNGQNNQRWQNEEYDAVFEQAQTETDPDAFADLFIQMNDLVINNHVIVPLVVVGSARGVSKALRVENIALAPFSYDYWNIANWNLAEGAELS